VRLVAELLETLSSNKRRIAELEHRAATVELEHTASLYEMEHRIDVLTARAAEADTGHRRIAELEHKVHLLTEAATMFLEMKAEVERGALKTVENCLSTFPLPVGGALYLPSTSPAGLASGFPYRQDRTTPPTANKEVFSAAVEELQTTAIKTDTLLAALHSS
jgi:hypothetical protein